MPRGAEAIFEMAGESDRPKRMFPGEEHEQDYWRWTGEWQLPSHPHKASYPPEADRLLAELAAQLDVYSRHFGYRERVTYAQARAPGYLTLLRQRPRQAVIEGAIALGLATLGGLLFGKILGRIVVAPDFALALLIVALTAGMMAAVAHPNDRR